MNNDLTKELGGMQHVTEGEVLPGDKVTFTFRGERRIEPVEFAMPFKIIGLDVDMVSNLLEVNVYRKMPVPAQGSLDHEFPGVSFPVNVDERFSIGPGNCKPLSFEVDPVNQHFIPQDSGERKSALMFRGLLGYFPPHCSRWPVTRRHPTRSTTREMRMAPTGPATRVATTRTASCAT